MTTKTTKILSLENFLLFGITLGVRVHYSEISVDR